MTDTMHHTPITEADFQSVIPHALRPYISVASNPMPPEFAPLLVAFRTAIEAIAPVLRINRPLLVVIGKAPFSIGLSNGTLVYVPYKMEVINVHIDDRIILIDYEKTARYPHPLQVACILEEFAHALMSISDETLVTSVVGLLYSGIEVVNNRYHVRRIG